MALLIYILICLSFASIKSTNLKLEYVAVLFRHGDRAPESTGAESYPNDPYRNYDYFPGGPGGLTNRGKKREYSLGMYLRERYNNFLGDVYQPNEVTARSTDMDRTKMSLLLVLSGLYPPNDQQKWHETLDWQPIPFDYSSKDNDVLLRPDRCTKYKAEFEKVFSSSKVQNEIANIRPFMKNLTKLTGRPIDTPHVISKIYHTLAAQSALGLELPQWTQSLFPHGPLFNGIVFDYELNSYNDNLRRLYGGTLLRNIIDTMTSIKSGTIRSRKIDLFSAHESNVVAFLITLGIFEPHVPEYSSGIFLELYRDSVRYYVKIQYYLGIPMKTIELPVPGCSDPCSLQDFIAVMKKVTASDDEMHCQ